MTTNEVSSDRPNKDHVFSAESAHLENRHSATACDISTINRCDTVPCLPRVRNRYDFFIRRNLHVRERLFKDSTCSGSRDFPAVVTN